jgi:hypothetical protein
MRNRQLSAISDNDGGESRERLRVREGTERRGHMRGGARVEVSVTDAGWLSVDADGVEGGVECVVIPDASSRGGIERGRLVKMVGGHLLLGREGRREPKTPELGGLKGTFQA